MKIALIGNMNNNSFALMRYFRDLGEDAHLLLYTNDGQGSLSHFKPESDTWQIGKWEPYIHQTKIPNSIIAAMDSPWSWLFSLRSLLKFWLGLQDAHIGYVSSSEIRKAFEGYDRRVASGIAPAAFKVADLELDIFYPYAAGVEFVDTPEFRRKFHHHSYAYKKLAHYVKKKQEEGIRKARNVVNSELGITEKTLKEFGVTPIRLDVPMVYNLESLPASPTHSIVEMVMKRIKLADYVLHSHSRLRWVKETEFTDSEWLLENKNNDSLIRAFSEVLKKRPKINSLLILYAYGPDVAATKVLCEELGISEMVHWLPKMERKQILWLLRHVDVGVGEIYNFKNLLWGGTGWEVLASGKPLLQSFHFSIDEYESNYGHPPPPMLPVRTRDDILKHLLDMADHPAKRKQIGDGARDWFNRYNGIGLAKKWLDLLVAPEDASSQQYSPVNSEPI